MQRALPPTGDAVGTLRVAAIRDESGIAPLYAAWKIPSPKTMSDNSWQDGSMIAEVDNANPFHTLYQLATGQGILNDGLKPRLDAASAFSNPRSRARLEAAKGRA